MWSKYLTDSTSSLLAVPNPNTPLAFLPPTLANQFEISCYVTLAALAAFACEWIMSLVHEYKIFRRKRLRVPDVVYLISRVATLGYCVSATIFQVTAVLHCQALLYIIGSFLVLGMSSTSLLFFYRVRAVYSDSKIITGVFGILWVATAGLSGLSPITTYGEHIGPTNRCILTGVRSFGSVPIVMNAANDTCVFLAISYKIISYTINGDSFHARAGSFFRADGLPKLSRRILQSGQIYYSATIGLSIVTTIMILAPGVPAVYQGILVVPNIALENSMACHVYRAIKLGLVKDTQSIGSTIRPHIALDETSCEFAIKRSTVNNPHSIQINVDITRTTDLTPEDGPASLGEARAEADNKV